MVGANSERHVPGIGKIHRSSDVHGPKSMLVGLSLSLVDLCGLQTFLGSHDLSMLSLSPVDP